jgi:hypothetical protein
MRREERGERSEGASEGKEGMWTRGREGCGK